MGPVEILAELANQYGLLFVVVIVVLVNAKAILEAIKGAVAKVYPAWRRDQEWRKEQFVRPRISAIEALEGLLRDARAEIRATANERRILQAYLIKHLAQYEHLAARTVAAIQDVCQVLAEQNILLAEQYAGIEELTTYLLRLNGHTKPSPAEEEPIRPQAQSPGLE